MNCCQGVKCVVTALFRYLSIAVSPFAEAPLSDERGLLNTAPPTNTWCGGARSDRYMLADEERLKQARHAYTQQPWLNPVYHECK